MTLSYKLILLHVQHLLFGPIFTLLLKRAELHMCQKSTTNTKNQTEDQKNSNVSNLSFATTFKLN
jgi:hypothetical protein